MSAKDVVPRGGLVANGALRTQTFETPDGERLTVDDMAATARAQLAAHGDNARTLTIWFEDEDGNRIYRSFSADQAGRNFRQLIQQVQDGQPVSGSDVVDPTYEMVSNEFDIAYVVQPAGGAGHASYKKRETPLFSLRDYKCREGDCLLAILRAVTPRAGLPYNKSIRRELAIPDGPVQLDNIGALEEYFQVGVEVLGDGDLEIERRFEDHETNICHATYTHQKLRDAAAYPALVQVILENENHFAHISKVKDVQLCPITGDYCGKRTVKETRERVLEQNRPWKPKKKAKPNRRKYEQWVLVFDFETVWDPHNHSRIVPYSVGWYAFRADRTADDFAEEVEDVHVAYGYNTCQYELIQFVKEAPENRKYTLVGYNNSRFDNFLMARAANNRDCLNEVFWANGSLMDVRINKRHNTLDLCRLCPGQSLDAACKGFQTSPRKIEGFDHNEVQAAFLAGKLDSWLTDNRVKATDYLIGDVLSTASLYIKLTGTIKELTDVDATQCGTIGRVAWEGFKKVAPVPSPAATRDVDQFFRKAITGGRTQNFKERGFTTRGKLRMIDVASLYPTVMNATNADVIPQECHYGRYPVGVETPTDAYVEGKLGIYRVTVRRQPEKKILPRRVEGEALDWKYEGEFETHTSSCSIELIRAHGGEVDVHEGYYWETDSSDLFKVFLAPIFAEKDHQDELKAQKSPDYNPAKRSVTKLIMNSLSGKTAQRNFEDRVVLARGTCQQLAEEKKMRGGIATWIPVSGETCLLVGKKPEDSVYGKSSKPSHLAVFIYEYSRTYMYHLLISRYDVMYMDTDSALISEADFKRFEADFPQLCPHLTGRPKALGDLEEELGMPDDAEAILLAPKMYYVGCGKHSKVKIKGVRMGRDKLASKEVVERDRSASVRTLHDLYTSDELPSLNTPERARVIFERIRDEGEAHVMCSQLTKSLLDAGDQIFSIQQRYLFKRLS